jgi:hypothetical protein
LNVRAIPEAATVDDGPRDFVDWLRNQVTVTMDRINRAQRIETKLRERACLKAKLCWDSDRQIEAEVLGAKLADDPTGVVASLKKTPQGCGWLLKRWALLAYTADCDGNWTLDQQKLAIRMMGTPVQFQNEANLLSLFQVEGRAVRSGADLALVARREIKVLLEHREKVAPIDEAAKLLAERDELANDAETPELRQANRHERGLYLRLRWLVRQIEILSEDRPTPKQEIPEAAPEPPQPSEASEQEEPSAVVERPEPTFTSDRRESKLQKAESRRQAKERKLERLRA